VPPGDTNVQRTSQDQAGLNTVVVQHYPVRFQLAPGAADGLGIAGADYTLMLDGVVIGTGTTDANGEIGIPVVSLFAGSVTVTILNTDYVLSFHAQSTGANLKTDQQRLGKLGYMTGYQLVPIADNTQDDGEDGPRTQQSIMSFQCDETLTLDGVIGAQTRGRLTSKGGF